MYGQPEYVSELSDVDQFASLEGGGVVPTHGRKNAIGATGRVGDVEALSSAR